MYKPVMVHINRSSYKEFQLEFWKKQSKYWLLLNRDLSRQQPEYYKSYSSTKRAKQPLVDGDPFTMFFSLLLVAMFFQNSLQFSSNSTFHSSSLLLYLSIWI